MGRVFFCPPPWDDYTFCARWRPGVRSGALFALDCTSPCLTALRAQFTAQKNTQQVFVADGDSFSATFFSLSFQRALLSVLKLSRWERFFLRELSCQHSSQQQHTREARM
jgi:hypothetical protein